MSKSLSDTRIGRRLRFRDLQVFFAVAECGGMARAAAQLGVTQPAVSDIIAGIESAFGCACSIAARRGLSPTIYGRALLKRGLAAIDELKQGIRDIEFLADPTVGEMADWVRGIHLGHVVVAVRSTVLHRVSSNCGSIK